MAIDSLSSLASLFVTRLDLGWTLLLLMARYMAFMVIVPGLGSGISGVAIRYPACLVLALVSLHVERTAAVPADMGMMAAQMFSELLLGSAVGFVPLFIVSGAQTAGHLASGTMGLNGAQLFDPSTSAPLSDLSRIYSDLTITLFLLVGGHHVAISALAGIDSGIAPGTFMMSTAGLETFMEQSGRIFQIGCLIAAPVVVALLLTNFVMGLISKAIPTVNIFIISFPLTIAIGFAISILALPEVANFLAREMTRLPEIIGRVLA